MNFKVCSTMKGKICFTSTGRDFRANEEFTIPEGNFSDRDIQSALKNGLIISLDNTSPIKVETVQFKNMTNETISIGNTGIRASAYNKFDVPSNIVNSMDIIEAVRLGLIAKVVEGAQKVLKKKPGRKKQEKITETIQVEESESPFKTPKGVHIARPDLESATEKLEAILDTEEQHDNTFFADKKQAKEKIEKLQKILNKKSS